MSYLVLARKYRPETFDTVIGQEHITDVLKNGVQTGRLGQAYLFCGPRGIGKTSCARILAKALNCEKGLTVDPCGTCPSCVSIASGNSFDVLEIDGASNRGIDEIRTIRENVKFAPSYGRYKVYIVDEVHMLTSEAFNALLKTLEEPPEHVKFIFATTDPNKVPATIISRCQRYDFKRIPFKTSCEALKNIAKTEQLAIDVEAVYAIAKASQGSFRDALSILDQVGASKDREIRGEDVYSMLGLVELELMFGLVDALAAGDCARALLTFDDMIARGKDIRQLGKDLIEHFRNLMVMKVAGPSKEMILEMGKLVDYPGEVKTQYFEQAKGFKIAEILAALDILIGAQDVARITESERSPLEIAFAKITLSMGGPRLKSAGDAVVTELKAAEPKIQEPKPEAPSGEYVAGSSIKNKRGQLNPLNVPEPSDEAEEYSADIQPFEEEPIKVVGARPESVAPRSVDLKYCLDEWSALTHAVSKERMSLATYLQEAAPVEFNKEEGRLIIGFSPEFEFYKDSMEHGDGKQVVERIFSEILKRRISIQYRIIRDVHPPSVEKDSPVVQDALDTFGGEIVSQWHNE